jgi:hypothetical protein
MKKQRNGKRILKVTVKRMVDDSPDTSHLGEYSSKSTSQFTIDRAHAEDCASVRPDIQTAKKTLEHAQQTIGDLHNAVLAQYNGTLANEKLDAEREALDAAYDEVGELLDEIDACDCGERGDMERNEYRFFNPSFNYITKADDPEDGLTVEEVRKYVRQDYERMERLHRGGWCYLGIRAEAQVIANVQTAGPGKWHGVVQRVSSGGLWGIESDSERSYIEETQKEELSELKKELLAMGFSKRAIATAFKNTEEKDE